MTVITTDNQPEPAWDEETRADLELEDVCNLNDDYGDDQDPPWPYLTSGPSLIIQSIFPDNTQRDGIEYGDQLGSVVITPYGPVLRLEADTYQGTMPAGEWHYAETVYGSPSALKAIGATDIVKTPY